jgi:hypothetical protein
VGTPKNHVFFGAGRRVPPRKGRASRSVEGFFNTLLVSTWAVFERSSEWSGVRGVRVRRVTRGTPLPADASSDSPQGVSIVSGFCDEEVPPNPTQERSCRIRSP